MITKATHRGTCQACGRGQKLPGGRLSDHGYTIRWNFFSGVCSGSRHLPFELSVDLIEGEISHAEAEAERLTEKSAAYLGGEGPTLCSRTKEYIGRRRVEEWAEVEVIGGGGSWVRFIDTGEEVRYGGAGARSHYDDHLKQRARQYRQYAEWQRERITGWTPQPLASV
jgi:hypothetical protein